MYCLFLLISSALAQLPLPNPPFLPPDASAGAQPSSGGFPNPQWATLLGNGLFFYEAQRSGKLPNTKRVSWRNDSALDDGKDVGLDLSGGYYDAGDYIKCTFPFSFVLTSICWGATDFGKGYDLANQTAYLDDMLRWGLDWLIKAHPDSNTLYIQVDDANLDNAYWGGDQTIPPNRPSYQINNTSPGTDAAAAASAAFSACSILYSNSSFSPYSSNFPGRASLQNESYAQTLLTHASQLYTFAVNATGGQKTYQTSVPAVGEAYSSSGYGDELALAALFLAAATNSSQMYSAAEGFYNQYHFSGLDAILNWDSKSPALPVLFSQIAAAGGVGGNLMGWQKEAEAYFDAIIDGSSRGKLTRGGLLYYDGDSDEASLNPALNAAMLMKRYAPIASTSDKKATYLDYAQRQLDYTLGNNPMSAVYVVGSNPNSLQNPHTAIASGGSDILHIDTSPPKEAYVIYGGVPGGPDKRDRFWDIRSDWPETELALDYNAPFLTLVAMQVANSTAVDPWFTRLQAGEFDARRPKGKPCDPAFPCKSKLSRGGTIAIAIVVTLVGLALVGLAAWWIVVIRRKKSINKTY